MTGSPMTVVCRTLGISRACRYRESLGRPTRYARADDRVVTAQIRAVIRTRASYGARRVRALVHREFATGYNLKRIQRVGVVPRNDGRSKVEYIRGWGGPSPRSGAR